MKTIKTLLLLTGIFLSLQLLAQDEFSTRKISVFKNGTAFFVKSGTVVATDGIYVLNNPPDALFGSIWVNAESTKIKSMKKLKEKGTEKKDAVCINDMLSANINKKVTIFPVEGNSYEAVIHSVKSEMVMLQVKEKWLSTPVSTIKSVEFNEMPEMQYDFETDRNQLAMEFENSGKKNIDLMYLEKGIGWFPNYLIELEDDKNAIITLKSTLINDAEDIENADVDFVVGVPNFKYNYLLSPLSSPLDMAGIISALGGVANSQYFRNGIDNNYLSNSIVSQTTSNYTQPDNTSEGSSEFGVAEGASQEDLYFYKQKNVSLKTGERCTFELMRAKVSYEHVYEVEIRQNTTSYPSYSERNQIIEDANKVWHSIKLKNDSELPWTTGTAMVVKHQAETGGGKGSSKTTPISQDMMTYTPSKSSTYLKITVSPDISVKDTDKESKREEKSKKKGSSYYDKITVEGSILIKNYKDKTIKLNIKRDISGELVASDAEWNYTKIHNNYYYNNVNPQNKVEWELEMKAGEEREIKYSYTTYTYN